MKFTTLKSDKLKLLPLSKDYSHEIFIANQGNVREFFIPFDTEKEVLEWIEEIQESINSKDKIETAIFSDKNELLGMIALDGLNSDIAEIRLWVKPAAQGKGIAKKATKMLLEWYVQNYTDKPIRYVTETKNLPSVNLAKSLNFKFLKEFVDEDNTICFEYTFDNQ